MIMTKTWQNLLNLIRLHISIKAKTIFLKRCRPPLILPHRVGGFFGTHAKH